MDYTSDGQKEPIRRRFSRIYHDVYPVLAEHGAFTVAVYVGLLRFANSRGECYPSQEELGATVGACRQAVGSAISKLVESGLLEVVTRNTQNGRISNLYRIADHSRKVIQTDLAEGRSNGPAKSLRTTA